MPIHPRQPTAKGPADWFTGDVYIDAIARGEEPSRVRVSGRCASPPAPAPHGTPTPSARPCTSPRARAWCSPAAARSSRSGPATSVYTPADEWHWHGAAPGHFMTHLSITEGVPGDARPEATWGEHVTDDQYHGGLTCPRAIEAILEPQDAGAARPRRIVSTVAR